MVVTVAAHAAGNTCASPARAQALLALALLEVLLLVLLVRLDGIGGAGA